MKIYYDYQIFIQQEYGGISRYFCDLMRNISNDKNISFKTGCIFSINEYYNSFYNKRNVLIKNSKIRYLLKVGPKLINKVFAFYNSIDCDIIHPTYYDPYILKKRDVKIIITVYDMIHELFPEVSKVDPKTIENKKKMIYGSDHIIAISENTKKDILKFFPDIPEDKISVIYIGTNFAENKENHVYDSRFPNKYVLFVGSRKSYKNFRNFFIAMKSILDKDSDMSVVCLGGGEFDKEDNELIGEYRNRVKYISPNGADVFSYAYSNARCFVFSSKYEGFGIPTLEAFSYNCPVLLSDASCMKEVGGEAAKYFDPNSIDDIEKAIKDVVYNDNKRNKMIELGKIQLKKFSWDIITKQIIDCYNNILAGGIIK